MKLNKVKVGVKGIILLLLFMNFSCSSNDDIPSVVATTPTLEIPLPTLTNISPTSGPKTTIVTIYGDDFGNINNTQVFFNEIEAVVQTVTKTEITAIVPIRAFTGLVKVISNSTELIGPEFTYLISDIQVSTLAGSDQGYLDGTGVNAQFNSPGSVAVDIQNNIYVADLNNHKIRKITQE